MRWPWDKRRTDLDDKLAHAERAKKVAEVLADQHRQVRASLQAEVERNHFADMLVEAIARRNAR